MKAEGCGRTPEHVAVCCLARSSWHLPVYHPLQISGFPGPPPAERALPLLHSVCGLSRLAYLNCMHLTAVACRSGCFISAAHLKTLPLPLPSIHSLITQYKFQWLWCLTRRRGLEGPVWSSQLTHENSPVGPQTPGHLGPKCLAFASVSGANALNLSQRDESQMRVTRSVSALSCALVVSHIQPGDFRSFLGFEPQPRDVMCCFYGIQ